MEIGTDWVKLAFNAPKDVSILRKELIEANRKFTAIFCPSKTKVSTLRTNMRNIVYIIYERPSSILRKELIEAAKVNREAAKADSGALDAVKKMMKRRYKSNPPK